MNSLLLMTTARLLISLLLMFGVFLLVRGHNAPGGGFIAGLVVASAIALYAIAFDIKSARALLRVHPQVLIAVGLFLAVVSSFPAIFVGEPFMTGQWFELAVGAETLKLGTPLLFDLGVFLVVVGMATIAILWLSEEQV